jgi:hypothetical protein
MGADTADGARRLDPVSLAGTDPKKSPPVSLWRAKW